MRRRGCCFLEHLIPAVWGNTAFTVDFSPGLLLEVYCALDIRPPVTSRVHWDATLSPMFYNILLDYQHVSVCV